MKEVKCKNCRYLGYDHMGRVNVCCNGKSVNVADFVEEDDTCTAFVEMTLPIYRKVDYDILMKELNLLKDSNTECATIYGKIAELIDNNSYIENV